MGNPLDELIDSDPKSSVESAGLDLSLDLDCLDIGDLQTELDADRNAPLEFMFDPITGAQIYSKDLAQVVGSIISVKSQLASLHAFENELRKAAWSLTTGETKTRRLTAMVDGEMRTLECHAADDEWPQQELAVFHAWCSGESRVKEAGPFFRRFVREKVKTERSPIKKEVKKLLAENFPEGSVLAEAKEKLLRVNKGSAHKLPRVTVEGEKLPDWMKDKYGDDEE